MDGATLAAVPVVYVPLMMPSLVAIGQHCAD